MVVCVGMVDCEIVGIFGIDIDKCFIIMFGIVVVVVGLVGVMYVLINLLNYYMGMDFLVFSFVVVVVGGMGSLGGVVLVGFLLGIFESFVLMCEVIDFIFGINQVIIYLVVIIVLFICLCGLMGCKGVMEE